VGFIKRIRETAFLKEHFGSMMLLLLVSLPIGQQLLTNIVMLILFLLALTLADKSDWRRTLRSPIFILPSLFYLFSWLSLLWSDNIAAALPMLETKSSFLLAPLLIGLSVRFYSLGFKEKALKAFLLGSLLASLIALLYATFRSVENGHLYKLAQDGVSKQYLFLYTHLAEPIMHPGYFASFLGIGFFIACYFFLKRDKRRFLYLGAAAFLFVMMLLLQARINLLAILMLLPPAFVYWAFKSRSYKLLLLPLVPAIALVAALTLGGESLRDRYLQLPDFSYDISGTDFNSATYRLAEWESAAALIADNFWIGTGFGDNRDALIETYRAKQFWEGLSKRYNAHNQYLESFIAIGLVGLSLLLLSLFYYLIAFWKKGDYLNVLNLLFLMICLLTESMFERMWGILLFTLFFPLMMYLSEDKQRDLD